MGDAESGTAGGVKRDISGSLARGINAKRLCTRMKKKDAQMCELRYEKKIVSTLSDDLFRRAAAAKSRLRADASAQAIGLDWQRRTGCGVTETYDPPQCSTSKPALVPRRSSIIFTVTRRSKDLLSSTLVSATVDFREASGAAAWPKCPCLQPPTRPPTAPEARPLAQGCLYRL